MKPLKVLNVEEVKKIKTFLSEWREDDTFSDPLNTTLRMLENLVNSHEDLRSLTQQTQRKNELNNYKINNLKVAITNILRLLNLERLPSMEVQDARKAAKLKGQPYKPRESVPVPKVRGPEGSD